MVRSKFPGKPSKIVNRKVVKSSKYSVLPENESSKAAENISYGLSVFNETFGDHEQVSTAFHGFSPHEVDKAREIADKLQEKVEEEYTSYGSNFQPEDALPVKIDLPSPDMLSYVEANLSLIGPVGWHTTRSQCQNLQSENSVVDFSKSTSPSKYFSPFRGNLKKHVANRLLQKAKKANLELAPSNRLLLSSPLDKNGVLNRKFVLPSRSLRSCRVIKPNKRFLDSRDMEEEDTPASTVGVKPLQTRVIELKKPRLILDGGNDSVVQIHNIKTTLREPRVVLSTCLPHGFGDDKEHVKLADLNVFGASTSRPKRRTSLSGSESSPKKNEVIPSCTSPQLSSPVKALGATSPTKSKLILKESILNVSSGTEKLQEGLFSMKAKKGVSSDVSKCPRSAVECIVCGSARFSRLSKLIFKFGSMCCDPCRKFIAKMTLRAKSSDNGVPCENGQGNCAVSSPMKGESFATKVNRCGACWLLMCVQRLVNMPENVRDSLVRMLPANMQGMTVVLPSVPPSLPASRGRRRKGPRIQNSLEDCPAPSMSTSPAASKKLSTPLNKRLPQTPTARIKRKAAVVSLANNLRRVRDKSLHQAPSTKGSSCGDFLEKPKKLKGVNKNLKRSKDGQTRQKLSLKGPRVKHVCRSASIVLGQPLATFPMKSPSSSTCDDELVEPSDVPLASTATSDTAEEELRCADDIEEHTENECETKVLTKERDTVSFNSKLNQESMPQLLAPTVASKEVSTKVVPKETRAVPAGRKLTRHPPGSQHNVLQRGQRRTLQDLGVLCGHTCSQPELISLDFWESYDPDEVCYSGFGLIASDPFNIKPVCFLCGSAGSKKLIHCASCCEPYHQFCVEMGVYGGPGPQSAIQSGRDEWRVDWVCPRCTVCHGCGYNTGHQLTICQRCHHSYHLECLGTSSLRKTAGDRLWICSSCLRCKSCNSADVTKFVGNLPFCKICFKLRQKGNFCPLCQGCYTDDDYSSKMMECGDCKSWVHAKCEGLSDEKYQVLSYLPESVEFICRRCCVVPPAPWWTAVETELQAGYNNIIKAITKNRKAYAMLKWSPQKACDCQHGSLPLNSCMSMASVAPGKRRLSFNVQAQEETNSMPHEVPSKMYHTSQIDSSDPFTNKMKNSSVFEFDDNIDAGENLPILSYKNPKGQDKKTDCIQKEYSKLLLGGSNAVVEKTYKGAQFSPNAGSRSDSGVGSTDDELKTYCATEEDNLEEKTCVLHECSCANQTSRHPFSSLLTIKKKVNCQEYSSIIKFHQDMDQLISEADSHEVKELYHQTLQEVFPWFDPKYDKVSRNSLPMSPCKPHHGSLLQYQPSNGTPEKNNVSVSSKQILKELLPKGMGELDDEYFYYGMNPADTRACGFCKSVGDKDASAEGRLLYCGHNEWVHVNCALWSAEVFEEIDGALQNVSNALSRGRMIRCSYCGKKGASVGCCAKKCEETMHFPCARVAGFSFMEDKNVFCGLHTQNAPGKPLTKASHFDVCRPVFVELDRRKKKSVEAQHVRLMIGSLFVQNLGQIIPDLSDQGSTLVPTQFCCTRLFWSSKEPWRIARYTLRTTVCLPAPESVVDIGHHITVDHSKEVSDDTVNIGTSTSGGLETSEVKKQAFRPSGCQVEENDRVKINQSAALSGDHHVVEAVMNHVLDSVCSREADEEGTDTQTSADLLPPELEDAIFEDLPQDLLAGISMQDIFQDKFLNYEEQGKDDSQEETGAHGSRYEKIKSAKFPRELKRSKSDVLPGNSSHVDSRLHQRSCSLAWSHKVGPTISCCKTSKLSPSDLVLDRTKVIQELRLSVKPASSVDLKYCLQGTSDKGKENQTVTWPRIMQVDGMCGPVLSCSDEGSDSDISNCLLPNEHRESPTKSAQNLVADSKLLCNQIECLKTVTSASRSLNTRAHCNCKSYDSDHCRCKRRKLTKRVSSEREKKMHLPKYFHIPQLDGANDISSDSEQEDKPVRCNRCGCTYRTKESLDRHLPSCTGDYSLTTSESETEMSGDEAADSSKSVSAPSPDSAISVSSGSLFVAQPVSPTAPSAVSTSAQQSDLNVSVSTNQPSNVQTAPVVFNSTQSKVMSPVSTTQTASIMKAKTAQSSAHHPTIKMVVRENQSTLPRQQILKQSSHQNLSHHAIHHSLPTSLPHQSSTQMITMMDYQQSQQTGPTVLVQSVPSPAMVPAYLEAFQQQTGQNLQYLATVDSNSGFTKPQYLAAVPSSVIPGAYQLQAISDGQLCLEPSSVAIPTISGIQLAQPQLTSAAMGQPQAQVLGTLLQNTLPCGVVTTEPIYETLQMFPDQSGGVLLASQPMLTCMETVVSNTFMSSSQFVASSVPGMMQGSSTYSTTTTQVFQASKVDSPGLEVPTQYVVVNTQPSLSNASVSKLGVMSISQPHIQEQPSVQTQAQLQIPSINLPAPVTVTAPLPPQTLPPAIPTSVVTPMPRTQPQRTYSKPSKSVKEPIFAVLKERAPHLTCSSMKETLKAFASQGISIRPKGPVPVCSKVNLSQGEASLKIEQPLKKNFALQSNQNALRKVANSVSSARLQSADLISTSIALPHNVTLPDPLKSNAPTAESPKCVSETHPVHMVKSPPVTFSYRSQTVDKSVSKLQASDGLTKSTTMTTKSSSKSTTNTVILQQGKQQGKALDVHVSPSQQVVSLPAVALIKRVGLGARSSDILLSKKPTAAVTPQAQLKEYPHHLETVSLKSSSSDLCNPSSTHQTLKVDKPSSIKVLTPVSTAPVAEEEKLSPLTVCANSSKNHLGKNVSLSLMTASITDSLTSSATTLTASMNSTTPVPTTKLQISKIVSQKPLKEMNITGPPVETNSTQPKLQEKCSESVPPTVLKSASQNIDSTKKNEVFRSQKEIPVVYHNKDKSPTSLKLLFQKQSQNGCYKVSSSPGKLNGEFVAVKLADLSFMNNTGKDKKGAKGESENVEPVEECSQKNSSTPEIIYEIHCQDGFSYSSTSISDAWQKVFGAVQEARVNHKMPPLIHNPFNSVDSAHNVMGLGNNSLKYLLEQLPGVGDCTKYRPVYHKSRLPGPGYQYKRDDHERMAKESRSGCARTEPYLSAKRYDMFSWLDSRHRRPPKLLDNNDIDAINGSRRAASTSLPMAMRFRHLRETSKTSVAVFRSDIHGRGLFCLRDIEAGEMVIEYAGEVIRNTLTDNREKYYQSKGIGCYMFKVDDNFTVDATQKGNAARFINHSCEPNCYSRVVEILGKKHIIIFAFRRIPQGEELTYDYKFPIEDEKIPCHCLSRRCRKYLN